MKITAAMLRRMGACEEQVAAFEEEWPDGADVTEKNALRAVALGLDVDWLATRVLNGAALEQYDKAIALAFVAACGA